MTAADAPITPSRAIASFTTFGMTPGPLLDFDRRVLTNLDTQKNFRLCIVGLPARHIRVCHSGDRAAVIVAQRGSNPVDLLTSGNRIRWLGSKVFLQRPRFAERAECFILKPISAI